VLHDSAVRQSEKHLKAVEIERKPYKTLHAEMRFPSRRLGDAPGFDIDGLL
jgi:hypothetical protein